jgi:hypothetical protein
MTDNIDEMRHRAVFAIATDLIRWGCDFDTLMEYSLSQIVGEEMCRILWGKAIKETYNL